MVIKKKEQKARLEMGGRTDKLPMANDDVTEWENRLPFHSNLFLGDVINVHCFVVSCR
jgi:hypothetical protein